MLTMIQKKLSIISRKDIKAIIGRSPDYIMAILPRFYVVLLPPGASTDIDGLYGKKVEDNNYSNTGGIY